MHLNLFSRLSTEPWAIMEAPLRDFYMQARPIAIGAHQIEVPKVTARADIIGPVDYYGEPIIPQLEIVDGIGIITVKGILANDVGWVDAYYGAYDYDWLAEFLCEALEDRSITKIALHMHSPGGSHVGMEETSQVVAAAVSQKPVVVYATLCASAAYRLASEANLIVGMPSGMFGSIGSKFVAIDDSRAWEEAGYKLELFTSNGKGEQSPLKGMLTSGKPMTDPERSFLAARTHEAAAQFLAGIRAKRPNATGVSFDGGWVWGTQAVQDGLIDGTANSLADFVTALIAA